MSKKRGATWRNLAWGALTEIVIYGGWVLLTGLLAMNGVVAAERCGLMMALGALLSCGAAGILFGKRTPAKGWGSVLCGGIGMICLLLGNLSWGEGVSLSGAPILLCALLGGIAGLLFPRAKKRRVRRR